MCYVFILLNSGLSSLHFICLKLSVILSPNFGYLNVIFCSYQSVFLYTGSINRTADLVIEDSNPASWLIRNGVTSHPEHSSSTDELWHDGKASTTSKSQGSQANRIADTTHRCRTLKGNGLKSVRKIAKIGRKYCCFGSF